MTARAPTPTDPGADEFTMIDLPSPALIGVIHLPALPGSPEAILPVDEILTRALADAQALEEGGFDAVVVENFGDVPFAPDRVASATTAAMAVVADHIRRSFKLRVGINVLRNDAHAALGIASAVGAAFIRVNVHTGVAATDQGLVEGRADESLRYRRLLSLRTAILADVHVKHARPLHEHDIVRAAKDAAYRGLADGLIVTGAATGEPIDVSELQRVRQAVPDRRVFVGSGATAATVASLLAESNGVIVGCGLKEGGDPYKPIDPQLAKAFVQAAGRG